MDFLLQGAGIFIYPLGLCSVVAVFVIIERLISLRTSNVLPYDIVVTTRTEESIKNAPTSNSSLGRIVSFFNKSDLDGDELKSFARVEMARLERGMFLLDAAISAAPLLGLLGTVAGLVSVFSTESEPTQELIAHGVGLALSTTILGLLIAIPAIVGSLFLHRKIDMLCSLLEFYTDHIANFCKKK